MKLIRYNKWNVAVPEFDKNGKIKLGTCKYYTTYYQLNIGNLGINWKGREHEYNNNSKL